ncbi:unnamed protein product [Notodromas monacha]|uniref:Uncharacterized protein n=1 Tax=Notodromas monacha TaxID=399045 RepID=A0A7R9BHN4_9CRUS|nr:unnamed protein product [Notodromas monacha]CAG0915661.1 unnamed protein product [Notodromas monacha]
MHPLGFTGDLMHDPPVLAPINSDGCDVQEQDPTFALEARSAFWSHFRAMSVGEEVGPINYVTEFHADPDKEWMKATLENPEKLNEVGMATIPGWWCDLKVGQVTATVKPPTLTSLKITKMKKNITPELYELIVEEFTLCKAKNSKKRKTKGGLQVNLDPRDDLTMPTTYFTTQSTIIYSSLRRSEKDYEEILEIEKKKLQIDDDVEVPETDKEEWKSLTADDARTKHLYKLLKARIEFLEGKVKEVMKKGKKSITPELYELIVEEVTLCKAKNSKKRKTKVGLQINLDPRDDLTMPTTYFTTQSTIIYSSLRRSEKDYGEILEIEKKKLQIDDDVEVLMSPD